MPEARVTQSLFVSISVSNGQARVTQSAFLSITGSTNAQAIVTQLVLLSITDRPSFVYAGDTFMQMAAMCG